MIKREDVFCIGRIGKPHGVRGEVNFMFDDDVFDSVDAQYLVLDVEGILVPFFMEEYRFRSDSTAIVKFCNIDTQEDARRITNVDVYFERRLAEDAEADSSLFSFVGYSITDAESNEALGIIKSIDDSTINLLFEVEKTDGSVVLVPIAEELIRNIDTENRNITMAIPQGLLEL